MAKTTFQGVVRSYGGQNKESNVFAGTVILSAKGILTGNTSVYSAVKNIDNNQIKMYGHKTALINGLARYQPTNKNTLENTQHIFNEYKNFTDPNN